MPSKKQQERYEIVCESGEKCILRKMDRGTLEVVMGMVMPGNGAPQYIAAGEIIINSCWIEGDEAIKTDPDLLVEAALGAYGMVNIKTAALKKI